MVILRKLAFPVQSNLRAHPSKIKNAASLLETTFEPFNFHRDLCVLHRNSRSVTAPAGASADWEIIADNLVPPDNGTRRNLGSGSGNFNMAPAANRIREIY